MSPSKVDKSAVRRARALRNAMTGGERRLWMELRQLRKTHGIHVRRQVPIDPYIADFAVHAARLVIELDGEVHGTAERLMRDRTRDRWLQRAGYRTLRIQTGDLATNLDGCIETILRKLAGHQ
ncbi:MAG: endonuclease domain-containing protein [Roseibium sp.]|nr:endonuclease domain-containing protein [Roseibium sp.]